MPTTQVYSLAPIESIKVSARVRKEFGSIEDLALSIERFGLMHPIIVTRDFRLVAGERRFRAAQKLHWKEIPVHFVDELNEFELRALELEENVQRLNMTWIEEANAVFDYHEHRIAGDPDWALEMTADSLGMSEFQTRMRVVVARDIRQGTDLTNCENLTTAWNTVRRKTQRALDDETEIFIAAASDAENKGTSETGAASPAAPTPKPAFRPALTDIYNITFQAWVATELSRLEQKFNVLHCDFPYGINIQKSGQIAEGQWQEEWYDDSAGVFKDLCQLLIDEAPNLLATHAHILFWYPTHKYSEVVATFERAFTVNPVPLVWFKSDSTGILPDPKRGPRRVYETALLMTRGDRHIVAPVNNCIGYAANRAKANHPSEKPYQVVHHFLRMLVDEHAIFLDPTCGAGTAVAAAEVLRAKSVTGIEPNAEHARSARSILNRVRSGGLS